MPKTILIADDDRTLTALLNKFLTEQGYEVVIASDGEEAVAKAEARRPDIAILDIQMPKVNGYSVLFELKKLEHGKPLPVIILTCKEELEDIFRVEGVREYLVKPVSNTDLLKKIQQHIG